MAIHHVLLTGADGRIGRVLSIALAERYQLRRMLHRTPPTGLPSDTIVAELENFDALLSATVSTDAIVHLAANPRTTAAFEEVLGPNIIGTYNLFEAAHRNRVQRIIFASTNHVTGMYERDDALILPELPVRPDSLYGVTKVYGEALGRYYHDTFGMAVICLRIGSFVPRPTTARTLRTWISQRDMIQITMRALEANIDFGIYYAISGNTRRQWDITNARRELGYQPEDDAEVFASDIK